jgi:hypothetical protein
MYHISLKSLFENIHIRRGHNMALWKDEMLYDEHFWRIVHIIAFIAIVLLFAFWSSSHAY